MQVYERGYKQEMQSAYTTLGPDKLWREFLTGRIYKGGGGITDPKMVLLSGLRARDFDIRFLPGTRNELVYPNSTMGLSFAGSIERLARVGISGDVWELRSDTTLPQGLVVHFMKKDHPMVNVAEPMPIAKVIYLLNELGKRMKHSGYVISRAGELSKR